METYFAGNDVSVTVPFVDGAGASITGLTGISYQVVDAAGGVLVDWTDVTVSSSASSVAVTVAAAHNALAAGEARDLRSVVVTYAYAGGTRDNSVEYIIEGADLLIVATNSFQTYNQAQLGALDLVNIDAFTATDKASRIAALINGYLSICNLEFELNACAPLKNLSTFTAAQVAALPARFLRALKQAQILEANELLDPGSVNNKRQSGLMSETIGESSMMFRPTKILTLPVTRRSLDLLADWISWDIGIGRAS